MKICLIIINYEGLLFLKKNIPILKKECNKIDIDLFVTDDLSKDNSVIYLKTQNIPFSINLNTNHGFASNVNNGIKFVKSKKNYDVYLISNNDIDSRSIDFKLLKYNLSETFNKFKRVGLIGFKELNPESAVDIKSTKSIFESNDIPGFFFGISKELISEIGFLDEEYFMYGEDNDYMFRTLKAGFKIIQVDQFIIHKSEGSSKNNFKTSWLVYRNAGLFAIKNLTIYESIRYLFSFINIIFNPFHKSSHPSYKRVKRSGILINLIFLIGSMLWNLKRVLFKLFGQNEHR